MGKNKINKAILFGLIALFLFMPNIAMALASGGIGVVPNATTQFPDRGGWFLYEVDPGEVIKDEAIIMNTGNTAVHITLESLDALLTQDGAFTFVGEPSDNKDIGNWVTLSKTEFDLRPNSKRRVPFTLTVPKDAEVGDHIGGLAVYATDRAPERVIQSGGTKIGISTRVGARMYLTVAGDIVRDWTIRNKLFYGLADKMMFRFTINNKGNIRANLNITEGKIYNIFGLYDTQTDINLDQVFPHESISKTFPWPGKGRPLFGPYLAKFTVEDKYTQVNPNSNVLVQPVEPVTFWMITLFMPYTQLAVLLGLAFIFWFIYRFISWKRLYNLSKQPIKKYVVKKNDNLIQLSAKYHISWKLVARLNNIKAPYSLHDVTTLYIPDASSTTTHNMPIASFRAFLIKPFAKLFGRTKRTKSTTPTGMKWYTIAKHNKLKKTSKPRAGLESKIKGKKPKK